MKRVVIIIIGLLAIFSILRAYSEETNNRLNIYPSAIEFADKDSEFTIGFGLVESEGGKSLVWNIFPVKIALKAGKNKFYLAFNGLSFITSSGINFEKPVNITGVHKGDIISFGGPVTVRGKVEGSVWTFGADAILGTGSTVQGDVVVLGGRIIQDSRAVITGNKYAIAELRIPFIGLLSSANSIQTIRFFLELFQIALFLLLLFLLLIFQEEKLKNQVSTLFQHWRGVLIFILFSIIIIPVLFFFLTSSLIGILMIPVALLFIIAFTYFGFVSFNISLGKILLRRNSDNLSYTFLCGLLGLFVLKGPTLIGILLTLLNANVLIGIGNFLIAVGAIALFASFLYGFGISLVNLRARS